MKIVGLLGGLSWISTQDYYRYINEEVNRRLGGLNFAECVIYSLNFADIQRNGWDDWDRTFELLAGGCMRLRNAGAQALVLCANTAHALSDRLQSHTGLPIIHIADATSAAISDAGLRKVGLIGTKFTMELPFFRDRLSHKGLEVFTPEAQSIRDYIQETLRDELGRGITKEETRVAYLKIINDLVDRGAEGIIFGCTEIPLLIHSKDVSVPVFDTTRLHSNAVVDFALS
jgi:aspartate racemase